MEIICRSAQMVAEVVLRGCRALVTCHAGINRSGIISAVAVMLLTGLPPRMAIDQVRAGRPGALRNPGFVYQIGRVKPNARRDIYVQP
jgi:protein-tyrosine phosphatase